MPSLEIPSSLRSLGVLKNGRPLPRVRLAIFSLLAANVSIFGYRYSASRSIPAHQFFLHDGRTRGPEEAILWHGGEVEAAAKAFRNLEEKDRAAVIRFLKSL